VSLYLSVDMIFQSLWFLSCYLDRRLILTRMLLNQGFLVVKLKYSFQKLYGCHNHPINQYGVSNDHEYVTFVVIIIRCFLSSFNTYHLPCENSNTTGATCGAGTAKHSGAPMLSGVRVVRSLVSCVMFCRYVSPFCFDHCIICHSSSFDHCIICHSSIDGFSLPLRYLQTFLVNIYYF